MVLQWHGSSSAQSAITGISSKVMKLAYKNDMSFSEIFWLGVISALMVFVLLSYSPQTAPAASGLSFIVLLAMFLALLAKASN